MIKRQFRIYMNGKFQFSVSSTESAGALATSAAETMKINVQSAEFSPGVINLLTTS